MLSRKYKEFVRCRNLSVTTHFLAFITGGFGLLGSYALSAQENSVEAFPVIEFETPIYQFAELTPQVHLRMDYASSVITNPDEWLQVSQRGEVEEIDLVFTAYPLDSSRWRTSYNRLLKDRLRNLFAIDPSLNNKKLKF